MTVPCTVVHLGLVNYMEALNLQNRLAEQVKAGADGWLLLLEHPHTYTFGRAGNAENLRLTPEQLDEVGANVYWVDRGGDVTYHGPGQLIAYPILDLKRLGDGPRWYVAMIEQAVIDTMTDFGIESGIIEGRPGVWSGNEKLGAIGLHISQGVSTHGLALNVDTDLDYFNHIVSCGLADAGVTSVSRKLGRKVSVSETADAFARHFARHVGLDIRVGSVAELMEALPIA
jgi:lipoate-protein ligase B